MKTSLLLWFFTALSIHGSHILVESMDLIGPTFDLVPPTIVRFSNSTGVKLQCKTRGNPKPIIRWTYQSEDNVAVSVEAGSLLFISEDNSTLYIRPFASPLFSSNIHSNEYQCQASNPVGVILSPRIDVRAVIDQEFELQVFPSYAYLGNTAVLKCLMPPFLRDFVDVVSWMWQDRLIIASENPWPSTSRYSMLANGELYIRNVTFDDGNDNYRCLAKHRLTGAKTLSSIAGRLTVQSLEQAGKVPAKIVEPYQDVIWAQQGFSVEIPCAASGSPSPTYSWTRRPDASTGPDRSVIPDRIISFRGGSVFLSKVEKSTHEGVWTCHVRNDLGSESHSIRLAVDAPVSVRVAPSRQRVDVGTDAKMGCYVDGDPVLSISWFHNGRLIFSSQHMANASIDAKGRIKRGLLKSLQRPTYNINPSESKSDLSSEKTPSGRVVWDGKFLLIQNMQRDDRGMYQCQVLTIHGQVLMDSAQIDLGDSLPVIEPSFHNQLTHEGQPITLECLASGRPLPTLEWYLDDKPLSSSLNVELRSKSPFEGDKVSLQLDIHQAMLAMSGLYTCKASNPMGHAQRSTRLDIYGSPFVRAMDPRSEISGADIWMHCPYGGFPVSSISWIKEGEELPVNERQLVFKNGSLIIRNLMRNDAGIYTCLVLSNSQVSASNTVSIDVMVAPEIEPFQFSNGLQEGGRTRVACTAHVGDLPIRFRWYRNNEELLPARSGQEDWSAKRGIVIHEVDPFTSSLSFPQLKTQHSGNYTCVASNSAANHSQSARLVVNVPPSWIRAPTDVNLMQDDDIFLDCLVSGFPPPKLQWSKADDNVPGKFHELLTSKGDVKVFENGTLHIRHAQATDEGRYLCKADNSVSHAISKLVEVLVNVPAHFRHSHQNQSVTVGEKAVLECPVEGDNPIKVAWFRNEVILPSDDSNFKIKEEISPAGLTSKLMLRKTNRHDSATFECFAENRFGRSQMTISLIIQEVPEVPDFVQLVSVSSRTANLTWMIPYDGNSRITEFAIQFKKESESWQMASSWHSVPGNSTWAELISLNPATSYMMRVVAVNQVGSSHPSKAIQVFTKEEAPEAAPVEIQASASSSQSLIISWKPPPPEKRHGTILGYYLGYKVTNSTEPYRYLSLESAPIRNNLEIKVDHLKKFTQYSLMVQAYNRIGAGPKSPEVTVTTAEDVPSSAPRHVQCTPMSSTSLLLMWSPPPESDMNGVLKEYRVFYRPLKEWAENVTTLEQSTLQLRITLNGLEKYQNYTIQIVASTRIGAGLKSRSVYCRTAEDLPDKPANVKAVALDQNSVLVSWLPPVQANGQLTHYTVYLKTMEQGRQYTQHFQLFQPEEMYYSVRGLNQNQPYSFWVTASTIHGEGQESAIVAETPQIPVPATVASFSRTVIYAVKEDAILKCLAVGQPKPSVEWRVNQRSVEADSRIQLESGGLWIRITKLQLSDSANYTCTAQNHFGLDHITYTLIVKLSRNNGVPPPPPSLSITGSSGSSISLGWTAAPDGGAPLLAYHLHYHREFGDWDRVELRPEDTSFTVTSLRCGTNYQFYIQAHNDFGLGERTETISARTLGTSPIAPVSSDQFIRVNSTSIVLDLSQWKNGGCPISSFVVEYKVRQHNSGSEPTTEDNQSWILVNNNVKPREVNDQLPDDRALFSVLDLLPQTRYTLRMTAHNAAGSTVQLYHFTTLTFNGATLAPELIIHSAYGDNVLANPRVLCPLLATIIMSIALAALLAKRVYKNWTSVAAKDEMVISEEELIQAPQLDRRRCSLTGHLDSSKLEDLDTASGLQCGYSSIRRGVDLKKPFHSPEAHPFIPTHQFVYGTLSRKASDRYQMDCSHFRHSQLYPQGPSNGHTDFAELDSPCNPSMMMMMMPLNNHGNPDRYRDQCKLECMNGLMDAGYAVIPSPCDPVSVMDDDPNAAESAGGTSRSFADVMRNPWLPMKSNVAPPHAL